jgi:HlyD family secretion protein
MDKITQNKGTKNKITFTIIMISILLICIFIYWLSYYQKTLNVNKNEIVIKTITEDFFEDYVIFQSKVIPLHSMVVTLIEGGTIKEKYVENGVDVVMGQPLLKLSNPNTEFNYMQQETQIVEQMNHLNKALLDLRNQEFSITKEVMQISNEFNLAKQDFELNKKLFEQDILAKNIYDKSMENFNYQNKRMQNVNATVNKQRKDNLLQINQLNTSLRMLHNNLQLLKTNKQNFLVTAPYSGRLSSFEPILGKTYNQGETIGQIDGLNGYKLVAEVDEFYKNKIYTGLKGSVEWQNKNVEVMISKILPDVKNGRIQLEIKFLDKIIDNLEQGMNFSVKIFFSEKKKSLVVRKGSFSLDNDNQYLFVVKNNEAVKRKVVFGRENPMYIEVLEGLNASEEVITSSYKNYKDVDRLVISY